jgi:hypothetical protein
MNSIPTQLEQTQTLVLETFLGAYWHGFKWTHGRQTTVIVNFVGAYISIGCQ